MHRPHRSVFGILVLCAACSRTSAPTPSLSEPLVPGTPERFAGEVVLVGAPARATDGSVEVAVRPIGGDTAIWSRSYEVRDPWWTSGTNRRSLPFGISKADSVEVAGEKDSDFDDEESGSPAGSQLLAREMELVVRFDPDGNPSTHAAGDIEVVTRARTGATDLVVTLGGPPADFHAGPDLSQTSGGLASPVEPRHKR